MAESRKIKRPPGRPTIFKPEYVEQARKLCELGATDQEIAAFFQIDRATFYRWQNTKPGFCEALVAGKSLADERVVRAMYHKAIGYTFDSEKLFQHKGKIVRAKIREHVPPDPIAGKFWLVNRQRDKWQEVQKHEHGQPGDFDKLGDEELVAEMRKEAATLGISGPVKANGKANGKTQH